ncbi:hypothetical protein [Flavihumibacter sp. CACIAM 22H1]|uniref:hypothetical protein n=1 Tax=Flavihumibacter sp. CACIAM 22H1 TaxID=1812911 RepID=UPI0007A8C4FE|nr:hypothetical protein [Flavihumibacter sp. CACIAM 22H1]KYP15577.1 MAG: hypothetical protein A1D16_08000 [Flavihumibacter sp. CACIAM 22H1]
MQTRKLHLVSGTLLAAFIGIHLFNHLISIWGVEQHIQLMNQLRKIYRHPVVELILFLSIGLQLFSGIRLARRKEKNKLPGYEKLQLFTGLYLSFFLLIHIAAILVGRYYLHLNTNIYFGAAGINYFPVNLFFIPYYALAILSFFGHIAALLKSRILLIAGLFITLLIFYGLTNHFSGIDLPKEYMLLIGR